MSPRFNPLTASVEMDFGFGPVPLDAGMIAAVQAYVSRMHDQLLRQDDPDRLAARRLRQLDFALVDAEGDLRAHQRQACAVLEPIPSLLPLDCKVVRLNPKAWGGTDFSGDAA